MPLNQKPVERLLGYLRSLKCDLEELPEEREDWVACELLLNVPLPEDSDYIQKLVRFYAEEKYRKSRTLEVWYAIATNVARCIQEHTH